MPVLPLLLAALLPGDAVLPSDTVTAFVDIAVIPMDRERVLTGQTVLVQDGRITAIGPAGSMKVPANAARVDGRGKWLIPGLADMHVHTSVDPDALLDYIALGVTTIRYMGGPSSLEEQARDFALRERVRRGEVLGPTIYFASPQIYAIDSPKEAVEVVNRYKAQGFDLIKISEFRLTSETLDSFIAAARRAKIPFGGHTPEGLVPLEYWLEAGPITVEHLEGYWQVLVRNYFPGGVIPISEPGWTMTPLAEVLEPIEEMGEKALDDSAFAAVAAATKRAGVWNVPTSTIFLVQNAGSARLQQLNLRLRRRMIKALHDAGAGLLVGTDVTPSQGSAHTELQLLVESGLTPYEALEAGTRNVALAMGTVDSTGTIEVGKRADLVVLTGDPLQDIHNTEKLAGVVVGGRWFPRAELDARVAEREARHAASRRAAEEEKVAEEPKEEPQHEP